MATFRDLRQKFVEEWNKKLIAGAVALSFLVVGFLGTRILDWLKRVKTDIRSISQERATEIARTYLGQGVVTATAFQNQGDSRQYIAAMVGVDDTGRVLGMPAFLLVSRSDIYDVHSLGRVWDRDATDKHELSKIFGVVDIGDGKKRVFTVFRDGGTGIYGIRVTLYDVPERTAYTARQDSEYTETTFNPEFSGSTSNNPKIKEWLTSKGQDFVIATVEPSGIVHETNLWRQSQRSGFEGGHVHINEFSGEIPTKDANSITCKVEDAQFTWVSFFKGGVFGYDKARRVHFAVWIPDSQYDWVNQLTSGEDYLWFGENASDAQFAFDKRQHFLLHPKKMSQIKSTEFANASTCERQQDQ